MNSGKVIRKLCALLLVSLLTGGCSREVLPDEPYVDDVLSHFGSDGRAWLNLRIQGSDDLSGTRAIGDDGDDMTVSFEDGSEFAINDVYILLFAGSTETDATFASAYKAMTTDDREDGEDQITKTHTIWVSNVNIRPGDKLWAFAVVNSNDTFITTEGVDEKGVGEITFSDGTKMNSGKKLEDLQKITVNSFKSESGDNGYYLMTSAPVSNKPGGASNPTGATISTLAPIPTNAFYGTKEKALANPAVDIFVERVSAKITVTAKLTDGEIPIAGNKGLTISELGVAIDRYNPSSYLVRHFKGDEWLSLHADKATGNAKYRYVDNEKQIVAFQTTYRTYWAEDVNYTGKSADYDVALTSPDYNDESIYTPIFKDGSLTDLQPFYVMENTFELLHQELLCSTQLLLRAKVGNNDFYTIDITGEEFGEVVNPPTSELGTSASSSFARGATRVEGDPKPLDEYLRDWLLEEIPDLLNWVNVYADKNPDFIKITTDKSDPDDVKVTVSQTKYAPETDDKGFSALGIQIQAALAKLTIKIYAGGYCYYRVPIRHFTDAQTPWTLTKKMQRSTVASIYLDDKEGSDLTTDLMQGFTNQYLGRYGVVRNNWYDISIDEVTRIGDPTPNLSTDTSIADDNPRHFVSLKISLLPWILHSQDL